MSEKTTTEAVTLALTLKRAGGPEETINIEYDGDFSHPAVARKLAEVLELEAEALLEVLMLMPEALDHQKRHCHLDVTCVEVHFETEVRTHKFPARSTWERVHRWGCKKFKVATDACPNLEIHKDGPLGPALNESKPIGHHAHCVNVWLVKPGPERNGR
jgi:hypothetical protein